MYITNGSISCSVDSDFIIAVSALPKTRTAKVMQRILNKIIQKDCDLGDTSTLDDDSVLNEIIANVNVMFKRMFDIIFGSPRVLSLFKENFN